jgi:hypothetical protein
VRAVALTSFANGSKKGLVNKRPFLDLQSDDLGLKLNKALGFAAQLGAQQKHFKIPSPLKTRSRRNRRR